MKKILALYFCLEIIVLPKVVFGNVISDDFVDQSLNQNLKIRPYQEKIIEDEYIPDTERLIKPYRKRIIKDEIQDKITIKIKNNYKTSTLSKEGESVEFVTTKDVKIKDKTYKKGTTVNARVETISLNEIYGVPSDLVIGNFEIDNHKIYGEIRKKGANRTLWVYPVSYLGSFFFGIGLLLIPIRGGHAKIKTNEIFEFDIEE